MIVASLGQTNEEVVCQLEKDQIEIEVFCPTNLMIGLDSNDEEEKEAQGRLNVRSIFDDLFSCN